MKLEQNTSKPFGSHPKQSFSSGSYFKEKIPNYINEINLSTFLLDQNESKLQPRQIVKKVQIETQKNLLRSQHSTTLQTSTKFFLFLGRSIMENYSQVILYEYMKVDGQLRSMEMNGIKGEISCIKAKFCNKRRESSNKKSQTVKNIKKSGSLKNTQQNPLQIVLLIGTVQGYLKTLRFSQIEQNEEPKFAIESIKLDFCQIVDLIGLDSSYYGGANMCLALSVTNRVYLVNFDRMNVIAYFFPTILGCQVGLGLSVNYQQQYFIQTCQGGYIIFWDFNDKILDLITKSSNQTKIEQLNSHGEQNKGFTSHQRVKQTFQPANIYHCISPLNIFHSATISGIKHCQLYGNLLLLVTQGGHLKLLAINKTSSTHLCQNQYTTLLQYQIQDGELITDVKFSPQNMEVFVVKSFILEGFAKKTGLQKYMPVKEYHIDKQAGKKKNKSYSSQVYKPLRLKNIHNNILPQRPRSKSSDNRQGKCYFERIIFNSELQIEKVDKIYPSHYIDCIQQLQMTEDKEIIVLRGREFYLIGATSMFKEIEIN